MAAATPHQTEPPVAALTDDRSNSRHDLATKIVHTHTLRTHSETHSTVTGQREAAQLSLWLWQCLGLRLRIAAIRTPHRSHLHHLSSASVRTVIFFFTSAAMVCCDAVARARRCDRRGGCWAVAVAGRMDWARGEWLRARRWQSVRWPKQQSHRGQRSSSCGRRHEAIRGDRDKEKGNDQAPVFPRSYSSMWRAPSSLHRICTGTGTSALVPVLPPVAVAVLFVWAAADDGKVLLTVRRITAVPDREMRRPQAQRNKNKQTTTATPIHTANRSRPSNQWRLGRTHAGTNNGICHGRCTRCRHHHRTSARLVSRHGSRCSSRIVVSADRSRRSVCRRPISESRCLSCTVAHPTPSRSGGTGRC